MPDPQPLIDIAEAARLLGVTVRKMRRMVEKREIPVIKIGHFVRFDLADIEDYKHAARRERVS